MTYRNGVEAFFIDSEGIENGVDEDFNNKIVFSVLYSFCGILMLNSKMHDLGKTEISRVQVSFLSF